MFGYRQSLSMKGILFLVQITVIDDGNLILITSNQYKRAEFFMVISKHYNYRKPESDFRYRWPLSVATIFSVYIRILSNVINITDD